MPQGMGQQPSVMPTGPASPGVVQGADGVDVATVVGMQNRPAMQSPPPPMFQRNWRAEAQYYADNGRPDLAMQVAQEGQAAEMQQAQAQQTMATAQNARAGAFLAPLLRMPAPASPEQAAAYQEQLDGLLGAAPSLGIVIPDQVARRLQDPTTSWPEKMGLVQSLTLAIDPEGVNDKITRGLGVLTSHDGTAAITYAMSNIRWVCQNTVNAGLANADRVFKARHTQNFEGALQDAQKVLGISLNWEKKFSLMAENMLRINDGAPSGASHDLLSKIEKIVWPLGDEPSNHSATIADNRKETLHKILGSDTCGENFGYNGWSVYNAFVEYADHCRPRMGAERLAVAAIEGATDVWKDRVASLVLAG
jgi:hypothetical protein